MRTVTLAAFTLVPGRSFSEPALLRFHRPFRLSVGGFHDSNDSPYHTLSVVSVSESTELVILLKYVCYAAMRSSVASLKIPLVSCVSLIPRQILNVHSSLRPAYRMLGSYTFGKGIPVVDIRRSRTTCLRLGSQVYSFLLPAVEGSSLILRISSGILGLSIAELDRTPASSAGRHSQLLADSNSTRTFIRA